MNAKTMAVVFYLLIASSAILTVVLIPAHFVAGYMLMCFVFVLTVALGLADHDYFPLSLAVTIPLIARLTSLTIASSNETAQQVILTSVFFAFGCSYAYEIIKWKQFRLSARQIIPSIFFILIAVCIGVLGGYLYIPVVLHDPEWQKAISLIVYATIGEEFVFRGVILHRAALLFHPGIATLITSLLYGSLFATPTSALPFLVACLASVIVSWLYLKTQRLWPAMIFTGIWKLVSFLMLSGSISTLTLGRITI